MNGRAREWAVILGASAGTGAAIARALAERSHLDIFGVHRGNHLVEERQVEAHVNQLDQRCHMRIADAGTPEGAAEGADELLSVAGPRSVKAFVHSIADASYGRFASGREDQFRPRQIEKTFDRMAHSFVFWVQELLKRDLLAERACIIGLTNNIIDQAVDRWGLVAAAKAALATYVKMLASELGPRGHRVMLVQFGLVETQAIRMAFSEREWQRFKKNMTRHTPGRRICSVEEVGALVAELMGEHADWFNGAKVDFTGGQLRGLADAICNPDSYRDLES